MARVRLKGVNKVTTRLADGRLVTYWYAWKGGPRLAGHPGSPEFVQSYEAAYRQTRKADPKTFHAIISGYKQSRDFTDLAPRTRRDYLKHIAHILKAFADLPIAALSDPRITKDFIEWRGWAAPWRPAAGLRLDDLDAADLLGPGSRPDKLSPTIPPAKTLQVGQSRENLAAGRYCRIQGGSF
jgi:hypothetical protein